MALDLGCGEGRNAVWLAEQGWSVSVVDFSTVALARTQQLARERGVNIKLTAADLRTYSPPRAEFDLVTLLYVHLTPPQRRAVLRRAARALRPGGHLLVLGYHPDHALLGGGGPRDPDRLFSAQQLMADLPELRSVRARRVRHRAITEAGRTPAVETLFLARRHDGTERPGRSGPSAPRRMRRARSR